MLVRPGDISLTGEKIQILSFIAAVRSVLQPDSPALLALEAAAVAAMPALSGREYASVILSLYGKVEALDLSGYPALLSQQISLQNLLWSGVFSSPIASFTGGNAGLSSGGGAAGSWSAVASERPPCIDTLPVVPVNSFEVSGSVEFRVFSFTYSPESSCAELATDDRGAVCSLARLVS